MDQGGRAGTPITWRDQGGGRLRRRGSGLRYLQGDQALRSRDTDPPATPTPSPISTTSPPGRPSPGFGAPDHRRKSSKGMVFRPGPQNSPPDCDWSLYDSRPVFASANTVQEIVTGRIYWVKVRENQTVTLNGRERVLYSGWNLVTW